MKKILYTVLISSLLTPYFVFASWWNPVTWFKSNKIKQTTETLVKPDRQESFLVDSSTNNKIIKATSSSLEEENKRLKKELLEEENKKLRKELSNFRSNNTQAVVSVKKSIVNTSEVAPISKPTTKMCLNGSVVSVNDYCKKTCPDGEVIVESLMCNSVLIQIINNLAPDTKSQSIKNDCNNSHHTKAEIIQAKNSLAGLIKEKSDVIYDINYNSDKKINDLKANAYKSIPSIVEENINMVENQRQSLINQAENSYNIKISNTQATASESEQNSTEVVCGQ